MLPKASWRMILSGGHPPDECDLGVEPQAVVGLIDAAEIEGTVSHLMQDKTNTLVLAWVQGAKEPMCPDSICTAVALFEGPESRTKEELDRFFPDLPVQCLEDRFRGILRVEKREWGSDLLHFANESIKEFFESKRPLAKANFWSEHGLEFSLAKACVTYLSLQDFRDLPIPVDGQGWRSDLEKSDGFLSYASKHWHEHVQSQDEAKLLEPNLDSIIDPSYNNVYLWTDQSSSFSSSGSRQYFPTRASVVIKWDIGWLAQYLWGGDFVEPESVFPARDLASIMSKAPSIGLALMRTKPGYYLQAITKKVLVEASLSRKHTFELFQTMLPDRHGLHLPASVLSGLANNEDGDRILEYLLEGGAYIPVTVKMLSRATYNDKAGSRLLKLFLRLEPTLSFGEEMFAGAFSSCDGGEMLHILLEHGKSVPITDITLSQVVRLTLDPSKFELLYSYRPDLRISPSILREAVECWRYRLVKLWFSLFDYLEVSYELLKIAAKHHGHELGLLKLLLEKCKKSMITSEILVEAIHGYNSEDKAVEVILQSGVDLEITDQMLEVSVSKYGDGRVLEVLLTHQHVDTLPEKVVDNAIDAEKTRLTLFPDGEKHYITSLEVLQKYYPDDTYLLKRIAETDFSPPRVVEESKAPPATALPDAATISDHDEVQRLLGECGVDVNATHATTCGCDRNNGRGTALQRAVKYADRRMTELLLKHGADTEIQAGSFGNPLQTATMAGNFELVRLLVMHGAKMDHQGAKYGSALMAAARANDAHITGYLLEAGADAHLDDRHGWTPYLNAVAHESGDVMRHLLERDASVASIAELIALPPTRFIPNETDSDSKPTRLLLSDDGLTVSTPDVLGDVLNGADEPTQREQEQVGTKELRYGSTQLSTDHPIVPVLPFYFEMTVVRTSGKGAICIGLTTSSAYGGGSKRSAPGYAKGSWAYHGDDGHVFEEGEYFLKPPCPRFGAGDTVGCGINFDKHEVYFTKNGLRLDTTLCMVSGRLFPVIGLKDLEAEVRLNFNGPFLYED